MAGQVFFAACIPKDDRDALEDFLPEKFVSQDRMEILQLVRKFKGTRFKNFVDYEEALHFVDNDTNTLDMSSLSMNGFETNSSTPSTPLPLEVPPPFPSVSIPKLNLFRRYITESKVDDVKDMIWNNPRYIINYTNDSPTIVMAGARYNAVHIAVRTSAHQVLDVLLKTLDNLDFIRLAYPNTEEDDIVEKRNRMLDLYLNTPDKVMNNTPLHFACQNGAYECVKILLEYLPKCDITCTNKYGKTCTNMLNNDEQGKKIRELFDSCMYVAVYRCDDKLDCYQVPEPCYGKKNLDSSFEKDFHLSAVAGPMSPQCAEKMYKSISSPKHYTPEHRNLRLRDPYRGVEKVMRSLTFDIEAPFIQYWSFYGKCASISSVDVLDQLETQLRKQHDELMLTDLFSQLNIRLSSPEAGDDGSKNPLSNGYSDEDSEDHFYTPPTSPVLKDIISVDKFFIESSRVSQLDFEVKEALELAINNGSITLDKIKLLHPFTYYWLLYCVAPSSPSKKNIL